MRQLLEGDDNAVGLTTELEESKGDRLAAIQEMFVLPVTLALPVPSQARAV
jgi:hypothetical protein